MDVVFITTTSEKLDSVPVVDGQIIALSDVDAYLYDQGGVRRAASQHNVVETLPSVGIQGSTYIITKGDSEHPAGMYVWANDNWIDVLRLDVPVCFIDLGDITSEDGWTMSGDMSDPLRTVTTFEAKNTLSEGKMLEIVQAVEENKLIVFNFSIGADAYHDYSVIGRLSMSGGVIIGSGIMHVMDSDSVEYDYTVALPLNNITPVVFVRTTNLTELISDYTFDGLSTKSKRILYAINELNDKNDVMYVTATLADENGNATLDKTYDQILSHFTTGGAVFAVVSRDDLADIISTCLPSVKDVQSVYSYEYPEYLILPLDGHSDADNHFQFNLMKEVRYSVDGVDMTEYYFSVTLKITSSDAALSGYATEVLTPGKYLKNFEIEELETTNKTLVGALNELNEKEDYKIIKMVGYSTDNINQIAIDVSSLGGISEYESNLGPNVALYIGTGISPAMLYYSDYQRISTFADIAFHTFVGYRRAGHGTEYTDLVEVQLEGEITESNTAWPENLRGKGYVTGRLTTIPLLTTSDSYDDLETTNKQIIEAINEVNTKAESAATSSNSLVIPIAAEVPETSIDYMFSKTTLAVYDSSYTSKFIDQKMTETTEVYVELMMSKTGNSIIVPLSQNTTNTRRLPNSASTQAAGPSTDIEYKNGPKLYFEKTLCDEDNYLGLCIELTLNEEDGEEVPTVVGYAFDATQINEDLEKDILLNMSDLSAPTSDDLGFVHGRTHYTKYDYVSTFINYSDLGDKYTSQGFYKRQINSSIQDFVEVGKCYQITINADDKTISLIGTGVAGSEEFEGYNVIGCESVAKLSETGEVDGNSAFTLWRDSELGWCIGWRNANTILNKIDELMEGGYIDSVYVSVSEVTETVVKLDSKYLPEDEIKEWAKDTVNSTIVELTQEEYDNLTEEEKNNGTIYMITDEVSTETAVVDIIKDTVIQVSQDEYDVLTEEQKGSKVYIVTEPIDESEVRQIVSDMHVTLTQDEYDALSEDEKRNGNIYMVSDDDGSQSASTPQIFSKTFEFGTSSSSGASTIANMANGWLTNPGFTRSVADMRPGLYHLDIDYWAVVSDTYKDLGGQVLAEVQLGSSDDDAQTLFGTTSIGDFGDADTSSTECVGKLTGYANYTSGDFDITVNSMNLSASSNLRAAHNMTDSLYHMIMRVTARRVGAAPRIRSIVISDGTHQLVDSQTAMVFVDDTYHDTSAYYENEDIQNTAVYPFELSDGYSRRDGMVASIVCPAGTYTMDASITIDVANSDKVDDPIPRMTFIPVKIDLEHYYDLSQISEGVVEIDDIAAACETYQCKTSFTFEERCGLGFLIETNMEDVTSVNAVVTVSTRI